MIIDADHEYTDFIKQLPEQKQSRKCLKKDNSSGDKIKSSCSCKLRHPRRITKCSKLPSSTPEETNETKILTSSQNTENLLPDVDVKLENDEELLEICVEVEDNNQFLPNDDAFKGNLKEKRKSCGKTNNACKYCDDIFNSKRLLRNHMKEFCKNRRKGTLNRKVNSNVSDNALSDKSESVLENKSPKPRKKVKELCTCQYCGKVYKSKLVLSKHKKNFCQSSGLYTRNFMCELCGKTFKQRCVLVQHMRTHSVTKMFSCKVCGKQFTRGPHVIVHMRIHDNIKPYVCETCGRAFVKSSDLVRHKRIHSDARNFTCPLCPRTFKRSGDVTGHMRSHTGDRPYKCEPCSKSYTNHSSLQKHKRSNCCLRKGSNANSNQAAEILPLNKQRSSAEAILS